VFGVYFDIYFNKKYNKKDVFYCNVGVAMKLTMVQWKVCSKIECKEKLLVTKWDSLEKHVRKIKNEQGVQGCGS
jgi:hypothetical protein